jgi:hypothetical protein
MDATVVAGLIAAGASLAVALWSAWVSQRTQAHERASSRELEQFKAESNREVEVLKADLQDRADRDRRDRESQATLSLYREPLTAAAFELQSRIYNIIELHFLQEYAQPGGERVEDAIKSTLFKFAQYFGWREILRNEIHFLRFPEESETRAVGELLASIDEAFNDDELGPAFMLWRDEQRALGELMVVRGAGPRTLLGYFDFFELYETNPYMRRWFARLEQALRDGVAANDDRLAVVQRLLRQLVMRLDPNGLQYPHDEMKEPSGSRPAS